MRWFLIGLVAAWALVSGSAFGAEWQMAKGPLATKWATDVSPANAHPEYPRPQMVRKDWLNLNGLWDYAIRPKEEGKPAEWEGQILVPFCVESALSGVMRRVEPNQRLWYRRTFETPAAWRGQRVLLQFGAVDWETTLYVNGREIGVHRGGYDPFFFDITDALKADGPQEIVLAVFDPTDAGLQPIGKQRRRPGGIMYTPTTGIWQTVWIEPVPAARIDGLRIVPDVDGGCLRLTVNGVGTAAQTVEAVALEGEKEVGRASGAVGAEIRIPIPNAKLWSPDKPFLYDLRVTLRDGNRDADTVGSYFGMRKIAIGPGPDGITRILLNGQFVFQIGPLDQGFWPDGIHTAATDAALRYDVEMLRRLGMNVARKHTKIEMARWYYWCDRLGLLVWQDMPSMFVEPPRERKEKDGKVRTPSPAEIKRFEEAKANFEIELRRMIATHINHPSIIMWVVFNEGWGQHETPRYVDLVRQLDPTRLVSNASGWTDEKVGDVNDVHAYPGPGSPKPEPKRAAVLGEFGGLGLKIDGHTWQEKTWGYQGMSSIEGLTKRYVQLLRKVWQLKDDPGLCAAIYTQTSDVETECNGLMTYDRAVLKLDLEKARAANLGQMPQIKMTWLLPTSEKEPATWRYTTAKPADDWLKPDFDDAKWQSGPAGFGTKATPGAVVRTEWRTPDVWLRRDFTLPEGKFDDAQFIAHHDEDCEIYVNGVLAGKASGFVGSYEELGMTPEGRAALRPGKNILAVHCHQTMGGQYIDVGIAKITETPAPAGRP